MYNDDTPPISKHKNTTAKVFNYIEKAAHISSFFYVIFLTPL